jgi:uncharacterized protein
MTPIPVTLLTAAAAVALNTWLGSRIGQLRREHKISVGDAGNEALLRRMRAQANFIENTPLFLILLAGLELSGGVRWALAFLAVLFVLARIAHGFGMEGGPLGRWRTIGIMASFLATAALAIWAVVCAVGALLGG